jgi:hypothetical protein
LWAEIPHVLNWDNKTFWACNKSIESRKIKF